MVVTLGTANRQPQQGRTDDLDRVGHNLVLGHRGISRIAVGPVGGHPQETRRHQFLDLVRPQVLQRPDHHLVACQLFLDEPVKWHITVERPDHVVAKLVGVRTHPVIIGVAFRVGIAGHVEPMTAPSLAVVRRLETTVDQPLVSIGTLVIDERPGLLIGRWQPQQVKVHAFHQGQPVSVRRKAEFLLFQPGQHERINRRPHTFLPDPNWQRRSCDRLESPPGSLFRRNPQPLANLLRLGACRLGTLGDPASDLLKFLGTDPDIPRGHRSLPESLHQETLVRIPGNNRRPGLAPGQHQPRQAKVQLPFFLLRRSVAVVAMRPEDRPDVGLKCQHFLVSRSGRREHSHHGRRPYDQPKTRSQESGHYVPVETKHVKLRRYVLYILTASPIHLNPNSPRPLFGQESDCPGSGIGGSLRICDRCVLISHCCHDGQ